MSDRRQCLRLDHEIWLQHVQTKRKAMLTTEADKPTHLPTAFRIAPDRRRHKRVKLTLLGRFMRASKSEYPCRLIDISVGGAAISSPVDVEKGEHIVVYFDNLGGLEGTVSRLLDGGFAVEFNITTRRRQKLAAQLTVLVNEKEISEFDLRRPGHDRIALANRSLAITYEDGETEECDALDVSISGASIASDARPRIGSMITVGKLRARVARHHSRGFGVAFIDIQKVEAIRRHFG